MEPLAPGTEEEPSVNFSTATKQEKERERLLSLKAILPNGKYGPVFEFKYINGTEHWYCNACACPVMGFVFHHEAGRRHSLALGNLNNDRYGNAQESEEPLSVMVAPGEPVPPGFEGQVEKVALIQERLDVFNVGPLVALEYLLELRDYDSNKEPGYLCVLCDKKGDPRTVLTHLASYKHILQYLQKHFPICYRGLAPYMTKQYKRNWQIALHEIAEAIEKKFGRLKPMPVEADKYEKDPVHYLEIIAKGKHFSELSGYTFEELINKNELTKVYEDDKDKFGYNKSMLPQSVRKKSPSPPVVANPIKKIKSGGLQSTSGGSSVVANRRRSLSSVSSITSSDLSDFDESKERKPIRRTRSKSPYRNRSRSPYNKRYVRRSPPPLPRREPYYNRDRLRGRDLMPWERPNYNRARNSSLSDNKTNPDKIEDYKKLCKAIDNDMDRTLKQHKKNPEKHPQYNDEWKKFWNKRYKELQAEAKDVSTHDFKPEWIEFWNRRMIELHNEEVKNKKEALRKRLGLPDEPAPISFRIIGKKKMEICSKSGKPVPIAALPDQDPEVIVIDDKDDESKSSIRSHSPWEDEPMVRGNSRFSREKSRGLSRDKSKERDYKSSDRGSRERSTRSPRSYIERSRYSRSPRLDRSPRDRRDRSPRSITSRERSWERDYKHNDYRHRERIRIVSELPWKRERPKYRNEIPSYYKPPAVMRDVTREPVLTPPVGMSTSTFPPSVEEGDDGEINVVAILRLLTALEEKLGSLGPKVIDLLAQALAMEKNEANSSENLLDNEINCVMFETVKEKLKGQLLAGLVEPIQEKAFKNAIKKTASLIHSAGERKKEREKNQPKVDPVKVPGIGTIDKAAIARQIANALVLQGKTDVTQAELEQLINAVVGMAEASRNSNKPMTTASFLEQITRTSTVEEKQPQNEIKSISALVMEVEESKSPDKGSSNSMEGLSDSDLQTLLQNFKDLSTEEQHGLINYLKKLEAREPDRVERLRKFVNLGANPSKVEKQQHQDKPEEKRYGRESPFSNRVGGVNPSVEENRIFSMEHGTEPKTFDNQNLQLPIDSDEDYTFEDVVKAASKNVKEKELEKEREIIEETMKMESAKEDNMSLDETKALISNIMSNMKKPELSQTHFLGQNVSSAELAKTLKSLPVNMASLANIVGSVQSLTNRGSFEELGGASTEGAYSQELNQPSYSSRAYGFNYGQNSLQQRPNVAYPLDKSKVTYPNYAGYSQGQERFGQRLEARRSNQSNHPSLPNRGSQYGNNSNYNNRYK